MATTSASTQVPRTANRSTSVLRRFAEAASWWFAEGFVGYGLCGTTDAQAWLAARDQFRAERRLRSEASRGFAKIDRYLADAGTLRGTP